MHLAYFFIHVFEGEIYRKLKNVHLGKPPLMLKKKFFLICLYSSTLVKIRLDSSSDSSTLVCIPLHSSSDSSVFLEQIVLLGNTQQAFTSSKSTTEKQEKVWCVFKVNKDAWTMLMTFWYLSCYLGLHKHPFLVLKLLTQVNVFWVVVRVLERLYNF